MMNDIPEVDIFSADFIQNPYPFYRMLRTERIGRIQPFGLYALTRYDDVKKALIESNAFSSEAMYSFMKSIREPPMAPLGRTLVSMDMPDHGRLRKIAIDVIRRHSMRDLTRYADAEARRLLVPLVRDGGGEIMSQFATPLALNCLMWLLGLERDRIDDFRRWTDDATINLRSADETERCRVTDSLRQMEQYFIDRLERLRRHPDDSAISRIARLEEDGQLTKGEALDLSRFLLFAGNKTTRYFIGNAILGLCSDHALWNEARALGQDLSGLIDELLRFDSPSQFALRTTREEMVYDGVIVPAESVVFLLLGSANHDERRFSNPDRILLNRNATGHLGLGHGLHSCIGGGVARIEVSAALGALFEATSSCCIRDETKAVRYFPSLFLRGLSCLEIQIDPR